MPMTIVVPLRARRGRQGEGRSVGGALGTAEGRRTPGGEAGNGRQGEVSICTTAAPGRGRSHQQGRRSSRTGAAVALLDAEAYSALLDLRPVPPPSGSSRPSASEIAGEVRGRVPRAADPEGVEPVGAPPRYRTSPGRTSATPTTRPSTTRRAAARPRVPGCRERSVRLPTDGRHSRPGRPARRAFILSAPCASMYLRGCARPLPRLLGSTALLALLAPRLRGGRRRPMNIMVLYSADDPKRRRRWPSSTANGRDLPPAAPAAACRLPRPRRSCTGSTSPPYRTTKIAAPFGAAWPYYHPRGHRHRLVLVRRPASTW